MSKGIFRMHFDNIIYFQDIHSEVVYFEDGRGSVADIHVDIPRDIHTDIPGDIPSEITGPAASSAGDVTEDKTQDSNHTER